MLYNHSFEEEEEVAVLDEVETGKIARLIVLNDEVNTFDWVIQCFQEVLKYDDTQAEQLSIIIHSKGKATVQTASMAELRPKREALVDRGLAAIIEEEEV